MKSIKAIFLILVAATFFIIPAYAMKMNIDPARAEIMVKPGEEKMGSINILNYDETNPIHVKAYVRDLVYLPDGSNDFLNPGATPWSLASWMKIGPTEFDIPAGKQQAVRYMISVPKEAKGGRYGVIFFETVPSPSEYKQVGATVNFRLGTVVLVTVDNTSAIKAKLTKMSVKPPAKDDPIEIFWTVDNKSNILIRPFGTAKIIDASKKEIAKLDLNKLKEGIFPNTTRQFSIQYKEKLSKGDYFVQIVLDYGGDVLLGGQSKFSMD